LSRRTEYLLAEYLRVLRGASQGVMMVWLQWPYFVAQQGGMDGEGLGITVSPFQMPSLKDTSK
jgi:hypothetical protein